MLKKLLLITLVGLNVTACQTSQSRQPAGIRTDDEVSNNNSNDQLYDCKINNSNQSPSEGLKSNSQQFFKVEQGRPKIVQMSEKCYGILITTFGQERRLLFNQVSCDEANQDQQMLLIKSTAGTNVLFSALTRRFQVSFRIPIKKQKTFFESTLECSQSL